MPTNETALLHQGGPAAAWGNLGLWPAPNYAGACSALADAVAQAAGLRDGDRVLSPGCGGGDELRRWIEAHGASFALGLDRSPMPVPTGSSPPGVQRLTASAGDPLEALGPALRGSFDTVLCVDAAYHFSPRSHWLHSARQALKPGGRIAFTDLTLHGGSLSQAAARTLLWPVAAAARIRLRDVLGTGEGCLRLQTAGFSDTHCLPLDEAVLDGFVHFVAHQSRALGAARHGPGWRRVARTAALLRLARPLGLGYALFSATAAAC